MDFSDELLLRPRTFNFKYGQYVTDLQSGVQPGFERCYNRKSKQGYMVKKYLGVPALDTPAHAYECGQKEAQTLFLMNKAIPRVPKLVGLQNRYQHDLPFDQGAATPYTFSIVTELFEGYPLAKSALCEAPRTELTLLDFEETATKLGAELLETIVALHVRSQFAHLNISTSSVMVLYNQEKAWDQIRLTDFGFCQSSIVAMQDVLTIDYNACNILPSGVCGAFGAPEHLRSVQLQRQGYRHHWDVKINGPAADMWSFGCVMYKMLTGQQPFGDAQTPHHIMANVGPAHLRNDLQQLDLVLRQHALWAQALATGKDHPLLERVRQCSATPDLAVDFFTKIFSPCHQFRLRADALRHPYLAPAVQTMTKDLAAAQPPRKVYIPLQVRWPNCYPQSVYIHPSPPSRQEQPVKSAEPVETEEPATNTIRRRLVPRSGELVEKAKTTVACFKQDSKTEKAWQDSERLLARAKEAIASMKAQLAITSLVADCGSSQTQDTRPAPQSTPSPGPPFTPSPAPQSTLSPASGSESSVEPTAKPTRRGWFKKAKKMCRAVGKLCRSVDINIIC